MGENVVLKIAAHVQVEANEDEPGAVLIDGRSGQIYACNHSGGVLAKCLVEAASLESLANALTERFDVDHSQALRDAAAFSESLAAADLLTSSDTSLEQVA